MKRQTELDLGELNVDRTNAYMTAFDWLELLAKLADEIERNKKVHKQTVAKNESQRRLECLRKSA